MKNRIFLSFSLLAALLFLAGCTGKAVFDYASAPGEMAVFRLKGAPRKSVAVLPFLDQRRSSGANADAAAEDVNCFYLGFFPLMPVGFIEKDEPEQSDGFVSLKHFQFDPVKDLTGSAFQSLQHAGLFKEVIRVKHAGEGKTDYLFLGRITGTSYRGRYFSYMITYFAAPALWLLGAPSGLSINRLGVTFELLDRASGKSLWTYTYSGEDHLLHWIYARYGKDTSLFPGLMKQAMNAALSNLAEKTNLL